MVRRASGRIDRSPPYLHGSSTKGVVLDTREAPDRELLIELILQHLDLPHIDDREWESGRDTLDVARQHVMQQKLHGCEMRQRRSDEEKSLVIKANAYGTPETQRA